MTETTDPSMNSFDKAADIEMQNFSDPLVEEVPNKIQLKLIKVETLKGIIKILLISMLAIFAIFSYGFSLWNAILDDSTTRLTIYIEDITNIASLSPENKLLHESRYNTLFNDPNRDMVNFDKLPKLYGKWPYIESYNYFRNYSYILQHPKLSLYIKLTTGRGQNSFATLVDRSVTSKSVEEIYHEYKFYDLSTFYQHLQYQQPVHRMTQVSSLWQPNVPTEYAKLNEYFWFLTDFIVLCNPVFYDEGNTTSNTLISRENVHKLLGREDHLNPRFIKSEIALSIISCFFPMIPVGMLLAGLWESERRWIQVSSILLFVFSIAHCIMVAVAMKCSGLSELEELITSLFGSQSVNVQIPEMGKVPKVLTYHTVELVISFVPLLLLIIFSKFVTS